jgi:indole-3-glycerol phosphate synthase
MNILEQLAARARERVEADRALIPAEEMQELAGRAGSGTGDAFLRALKKPGISMICEVKKASPSKGLISPDFPYLQIARDYEAAGADCISCLTEPTAFLGSDRIFRDIRSAVSLPMLRKDFTVDPYQLDQAKAMGANAALLIVSLLDDRTLESFLSRCRDLGLAALTEAHDGEEIDRAVRAGAEIIGVNNRNLKDFSVDFGNAARLRDRIPASCVYVAESGVRTPEDMAMLKKIGADAALVGEALMRAEDKAAMLRSLREGV